MHFPQRNKNNIPAHFLPALTPPPRSRVATLQGRFSPRPDTLRSQAQDWGPGPLLLEGHPLTSSLWHSDLPPWAARDGSGTEPVQPFVGQAAAAAQLSSGRMDGVGDECGLGKSPDVQWGHAHEHSSSSSRPKLF
uniref:Uncharacterized protein n=1 Tax=Myotis myotis TaxID=51298 RepID=A0A7J7VZG9_MYOMY|nr:hypothetical protein mMyoMyo1_012380 [Myotis myotis]